uniref:Xylose isomerase domain-containing protein n=1 Tax=uncultured bacterium Contig11 TaxID=1393376 RepID=W0FPL1_9BACT|nr:xylose isomerase domain-containing protein [uncultured bacterium Contig11]
MLLGGTIVGQYNGTEEWEKLLVRSGFKAITAPFSCQTPRGETDAYCEITERHHVKIAEIGVWKNLLDPDREAAAAALAYAKGQLALAEERGIPCCVNIAGTAGTAGWDAADVTNFTEEIYDRTIRIIREIIDEVKPERAYYCIEPMPWMVPDGPDEYLQLIRDVDRRQFGAHMDFINMINCPRRYLAAEAFIEECFRKLAPYIRSTHIKDTRMDPERLTTFLAECAPGEGTLDYGKVLRIIDRWMPADAPVLLEHMQTEEEFRTAYAYVAREAERVSIRV